MKNAWSKLITNTRVLKLPDDFQQVLVDRYKVEHVMVILRPIEAVILFLAFEIPVRKVVVVLSLSKVTSALDMSVRDPCLREITIVTSSIESSSTTRIKIQLITNQMRNTEDGTSHRVAI